MIWQPAVTFVNARVVTERGVVGSVRCSSRLLALDERPRRGDVTIDLDGAFVLPGLVNAHDHLELNHYGRWKFRERYCNASEWIEDMRPQLAEDDDIREARNQPLRDRLFIGALKNLLSGVTTVMHHNPFYRELRRGMPIRVVRRYGWAHSFFLQDRPAGARGEPGGDIQDRCRSTPAGAPFFVHLGEGLDAAAYGELSQLEALGCLMPNTVLVHGVAIDAEGWRRVARAGAGLVWCPASNAFLFSQTAAVRHVLDTSRECDRGVGGRVALGTDSRLTGSRDLLDELRVARSSADVTDAELLDMVTTQAAALLREADAGRLALGAPADFVVIPPLADDAAAALAETTRRDVMLVAVGGRPLVAAPELASMFHARRSTPRGLRVDEAPKLADPALARRIAHCSIAEPGVTVA